ncbi:mobilization protein [Methylorubrum sp. Q1]|nr:mobilization protein [Methylorubrum sp. Q1]
MSATRTERIEAARLRLEQAKNRLRQLEARASQEERKRDTRRKIILGGLLLDAAGKEPRFAGLLDELVGRIQRPQDRTAFDDWSLHGGVAQAADRIAERA